MGLPSINRLAQHAQELMILKLMPTFAVMTLTLTVDGTKIFLALHSPSPIPLASAPEAVLHCMTGNFFVIARLLRPM